MMPDEVLAGIPSGLRRPLLAEFNGILKNYRERRWGPAELDGGRFCEVVYSILKGRIDGRFPARPAKPQNMVDACRTLEKDQASFGRPVCIQIPRVLVGLYEVRNNRGVGHVGGDVDPSEMDTTFVVSTARWVMAELIRIFHGLSTEAATNAVQAVIQRTLPIVWEVNGIRRVLVPGMSMLNKALASLYAVSGPVSESDLVNWVEHSNPTVFRKSVLLRAHRERLVEYDREHRTVVLTPLGIQYVEKRIPLHV